MRRSCAALATLALVCLSLLVAGPAQAGGPTSVLLVVPGAGQTASLYNGDPDYALLDRWAGAIADSDATGEAHQVGQEVTLTWLVHDVQVWRVDRVYVDAPGGPWISTQLAVDDSAGIWQAPAVWHTSPGGRDLTSLLDRLGVLPGGSGSDTAAGKRADVYVSPPVANAPAAASKQSKQSTGGSGPGSMVELVWALGGVALGVVLTLAVGRLAARSRTVPATDVETDDGPATSAADGLDEPGPELAWSATEELSWPGQRR